MGYIGNKPTSTPLTSSDLEYSIISTAKLQNNAITNPKVSDDAIGVDELSATGTASSSTFLRGDNAWASASADADDYFATSGLSSKDLGIGLHVKSADSGASVANEADELVVEGSGDAGISILSGTGSTGGINFGDSGDNDIGRLVYNQSDNSMRFITNASERMRILSEGTQLNNGGGGTNSKSYWVMKLRQSTDDSATNYMMAFANASDSTMGSIQTNGTSSTSYNTSSDYRLKENETSITDGIERLKQLKPYKFNFKTDADKTVDGFFAHEVSSIVPEAISGEKDAMIPEVLYTADDELPEGKNIGDVKKATKINPQQIDQAKLVPLLTSALQEAITKIETLETEMTALKARVTTLEE